MNKTILALLLMCGATALLNAEVEAPPPQTIRDYWFNGAEISRFELTQARYGAEHPGNAVFVFVTEPFLLDQQVKDEGGSGDSVPVLKLNEQREFYTGIYPYRTMTSVFDPVESRPDSSVLKVTTSVQEWCGHVFMQWNRRPGALQATVLSYFEKEDGGRFQLPANALLEDGLWTQVRLDPAQLPVGDFEMVPSSLYLRFAHRAPKLEKATGRLETEGDLWKYIVAYPELGRTLVISFRRAFPHVIEGWEESQRGMDAVTRARLTHRIEHQYYWQENQPKDRALRQKLGLRENP